MEKIKILVIFIVCIFLTSSGVFASSVEDYKFQGTYQKNLLKKIKRNMTYSKVNPDLKTVLEIELTGDEKFKDVKIIKSSLNNDFDEAAKKAVLNSIDKSDKLLRTHKELTFKGDNTVSITDCGMSETDKILFYNQLNAGEISKIIPPVEAQKLKGNCSVIIEFQNDGKVLNTEVICAEIKAGALISEKAEKIKKLPKIKDPVFEKYYLLISWNKYNTYGKKRIFIDKNKAKEQARIFEKLYECVKTIEKMWQASDRHYYQKISTDVIISKDGYVKDFSFSSPENEIVKFIIKNVKLPKFDFPLGYDEYFLSLSFIDGTIEGKSVEESSFLAAGIDWGPYMRKLEQSIKRNWNPPKDDKSKRIRVIFEIDKSGRLNNLRVSQSSGKTLNDEAAKRAVELAAPFDPLPEAFVGESVPIEFTFDYNVLGNGMSGEYRRYKNADDRVEVLH